MVKNTAGQSIGAQLVSATDGSAYAGVVTVYITIDAGTQAIGSVGSGVCTAEGHGYYTYQPAQAETNGDLIAFTFIGSGAIPQTIQVATIVNPNAIIVSGVTATSTTTSAGDLITAAFRRISVLGAGQTPTADDMADAKNRLNDLIDAIGTEPLMMYGLARTTFSFTTSKGVPGAPYTVGAAGDIACAVPRAADVHALSYINQAVSPVVELPIRLLTEQAYLAITQKTLTSPLPTYAYYEPSYPTGSLYTWFVSTQSSLLGVFYAMTPISQFGALTDVVSLPAGYRRYLRENLAVELWPEWRGKDPIDPMLLQNAIESKSRVKSSNVRMTDLNLDPAILPHGAGRYSILSDLP